MRYLIPALFLLYSPTMLLSQSAEVPAAQGQSISAPPQDSISAEIPGEKPAEEAPPAKEPLPVEQKPVIETEKERKEREIFKQGLTVIFSHESLGKSDEIGKILASHYMVRVRIAAARALGRMRKGPGYLHQSIDNDGELVIQAAYEALGRIGSRSSVSYFIRGTKNSDPRIKAASILGLARAGEPAGYDLAHENLGKTENEKITAAAVEALGYYSRIKDLALIQKYMSAKPVLVREAAIQALGKHASVQSAYILYDEYGNSSRQIAIIDAIGSKKHFPAEILLLRMFYYEQDSGLKEYLQHTLLKNRVFGKFALIKKQEPVYKKAGGKTDTVMELPAQSFFRIEEKSRLRYAIKSGSEINEEYFYRASIPSGSRKKPVSGWLFGKGLEFINISPPK